MRTSEELYQSANKVRELKDAMKMIKQENVSLASLVRQREAQVEGAVRDSKHLQKRINWITSLKQSQIRGLKGDFNHLKRALCDDLQSVKNDFATKT